MCEVFRKYFHNLSSPLLHRCTSPTGKSICGLFICHLPGYLTLAWPWEALLSSEDEAAILSLLVPSLNTYQEMKDKGEKKQKKKKNLMMERWKGSKLQWEEPWEFRFNCRLRNEELALQHRRWGERFSSSLCWPTLPSSFGLSLKWTTGPGWVLVDLWGQEQQRVMIHQCFLVRSSTQYNHSCEHVSKPIWQ